MGRTLTDAEPHVSSSRISDKPGKAPPAGPQTHHVAAEDEGRAARPALRAAVLTGIGVAAERVAGRLAVTLAVTPRAAERGLSVMAATLPQFYLNHGRYHTAYLRLRQTENLSVMDTSRYYRISLLRLSP